MTDFLLELRSEEIPARMQDKAREDLARLFAAELDKAGLKAAEIVTYATPRRLALIARDLPAQTQAVSEELKGPPADAPDAAVEGFLRKAGLTRDALETREVKGRATLFAVIDKPGRATAEVLAEAIPAIIRAFPWPKSMRWGDASISTESPRWVRPLQGIIALFGDDVVPCAVAGVESGAATVGHRFHHPGVITIGSASDYVEKLRACHVIVDQNERRATIALGAKLAANMAGLTLIEDEGLVSENAGLTEWPVPLLGRFDEAFLDVPPEVIQLTARVNQKYFVCRDAGGKLANAFICTANIDAADGGERIVEGNRKVLAARLSDARFFYETDLKVLLADQAKKLEKIVFHEKLGTVADKVDRVAKLARWLAEEGIVKGADPDLAERAARLAKADLVTGMVGEFPELQGLMGGYYAAAQGEAAQVAEAIRDHYKPVGQGDDVPTAPVTVAVSLADKLDTLFSFFAWGLLPTGSKDPFALRRAALGVIQVLERTGSRLPFKAALELHGWQAVYQRVFDDHAYQQDFLHHYFSSEQLEEERFSDWFERSEDGLWTFARSEAGGRLSQILLDFFADRLKVQQREAGVRHDLIDAVFALGGEDDLVRLLARVKALQSFVGTEDGANLLAGYKRAANILKKEGYDTSATSVIPAQAGIHGAASAGGEMGSGPRGNDDAVDEPTAYDPDLAEAALVGALDVAEPAAREAIARQDFEAAMAALASLRAPIDSFFDQVTVNDADPDKRAGRLALLARVRAAVHGVADFSRIEG
ncbi:glycine--tRNA ligase subunit beta [Sphingomonas mucosissima]|uniref:Glycine--tRNA ligase beta subunit n=1 Tax=Sphingomonas mucosissima TaxID=370959 RepID=A0A245ZEW4_9SPHN|nr:glycine--tRNA ligase subunit beta [Sphingomonas mucosissima]OWK28281.1 glycine--tRNA ligase beta subunit [Sphingomonas mucosissima]